MTSDASKPMPLVEHIVYIKTWSKTFRRFVEILPDWITPNRVTLFRGSLALPIFWALSVGRYWTALTVFAVAMALDVLDGAIAHIKGMSTASGAFLDPLADKLIVCGTLVALWNRLPNWILFLAGATLLFAAAITLLRMYRMFLARRLDGPALAKTVAAKTAGKVKTIFDVLAIAVIMTGLALDSPPVIDAGGTLIVGGSFLAGVLYLFPVGRVIGLHAPNPSQTAVSKEAA